MVDLVKVKARREKLGLTMDEAAKLAGFANRQQWYKIESGQAQDVRVSTLDKLAAALKCDPKSLLK